jgi:hypothetical protein
MQNIPELAGKLATSKLLFGPHSRYAVAAVYTRFDAIEWCVWDAETIGRYGESPGVIRRKLTLHEAIAGLES